jgi:hypothetical protein
LIAYGEGGEQAYLGGDGAGNDVQLGSLNPTVSNIAAYNAATGQYMNMIVRTLTIIGGADLAEPFAVGDAEIPEGSVVVIDDAHPGHLTVSTQSYDTRVAGVVSGANGVKPGIQMSQRGVVEAQLALVPEMPKPFLRPQSGAQRLPRWRTARWIPERQLRSPAGRTELRGVDRKRAGVPARRRHRVARR